MRADRTYHRLMAIWGVAVLVFLFLPIIVITIHSFNGGRLLVAFDHFSLEPFTAIVRKAEIRNTVIVSLSTAAVAALTAATLGTLAGIAVARRPGKWTAWFVATLVLVAVTPEIVDGVALLPWLETLKIDAGLAIFANGTLRLVIGHSLFAIVVVTFIVRSRLTGIDARLEEAAADLYAPPMRTFWKITVPLVMPAVLSGTLLAFTLSLDNTVVSSFVFVPGSTPWPVYVLSAVRSGLRPEIAAVSTIMFLLTLLALGLVALVLRRTGDSTAEVARTLVG